MFSNYINTTTTPKLPYFSITTLLMKTIIDKNNLFGINGAL